MPAVNANPRRPDDDSLIRGRNWLTKRLVHLLVRWTPRCSEMRYLISEGMDHRLPRFTRGRMRVHYLICCYCEHYEVDLYYLRSVLKHAHEKVDEMSDAELTPEAKQTMKKVLRTEIDAA